MAATSRTIKGTAKADTLVGTAKSETFTGGERNDTLTGGGGQDTFVFEDKARTNGVDTITDFTAGSGANGDTLDLTNALGKVKLKTSSIDHYVWVQDGKLYLNLEGGHGPSDNDSDLWANLTGVAAGARIHIVAGKFDGYITATASGLATPNARLTTDSGSSGTDGITNLAAITPPTNATGTVYYSLDNQTWSTVYTAPVVDGLYTVYVKQVSGALSSPIQQISFTLDTQADVGGDLGVAFGADSIGAANVTDVVLTLSGVDADVDPANIVVHVADGTTTVSATLGIDTLWHANVSSLLSGTLTASVSVTDVAGNSANGTSDTATLSLSSPPTISTGPTFTPTQVVITADDADAADTIALYVGATSLGSLTKGSSTSVTLPSDALRSGELTVHDSASNVTSTGYDLYLGTASAETISAAASTRPAVIYGFDGADSITGTAQADILVGGAGTDTLDGGAGADRYVLANDGSVDQIQCGGFTVGAGGDVLDFSAFSITSSYSDVATVQGPWSVVPDAYKVMVFTENAIGDATALATMMNDYWQWDGTGGTSGFIGVKAVMWEIDATHIGVGLATSTDKIDNNNMSVVQIATIVGFADQAAVDAFTGAHNAGLLVSDNFLF